MRDIHFERVPRGQGWGDCKELLYPVMLRGGMHEGYLLEQLGKGEAVLVRILHEHNLVGAFVWSIGHYEGARVFRVDLLAGDLPKGWIKHLDYFISCLAVAAQAKYIDFYTLHRASRIAKMMGFKELGTLYRREFDGCARV